MSYSAKVFRVLIASPSDVEEEREIAVRTIQEWNDLHSHERQIVLLPLRWETHTAPEYGKRPQEIINRQIVDHCDLLIGIFWTRIGSPTGEAESGTLEEIERVANDGKPVMLYFSQIKKDPELIDLQQLASLREFKSKTFPLALVESYSNHITFRDKLAKQLEMKLRELIAQEGSQGNLNEQAEPNIDFCFANAATGEQLGPVLEFETVNIEVSNLKNVPDFTGDLYAETKSRKKNIYSSFDLNKDYYRDLVRYAVSKQAFQHLAFSLENTGVIGARDIYIDISLQSTVPGAITVSANPTLLKEPSKHSDHFMWDTSNTQIFMPYKTAAGEVRGQLEISALQPKRVVKAKEDLLISSKESTSATFSATIYADILPTPIKKELTIRFRVEKTTMDAFEILSELGIDLPMKEMREEQEN